MSLSFDAAWGNEFTQDILRILDQYQVKCTFFLVGFWIDEFPQDVKEIARRGHEIGSHSLTHPDMTTLSRDQILQELDQTAEKIQKLTGKSPELFRAPYGAYHNTLIETARSRGYQVIQWDVDSLDWKELPLEQIVERVVRNVTNGSIVLFHNNAQLVRQYLPQILEKLQTDRRVVVSELSQLYDVSEETIRRDLEKLVNDGYAIKSYGGAVINENVNIELPFNIRKNRNIVGKQHIAELVVGLVKDGDSIMLDASTTAVYIAKALQEKGRKNLTVITNSIEIIIELFDVQDWTVLSTGGASREGSFALVGPQTDRMLGSYHVDKAIISCKGIDVTAGFTDSDDLHANNKRTMLKAAKEKILAIDSSKFDRIAFTEIGTLDDLTTVITNEKPEDKWLQVFKDSGIQCIYPK